MNTEFTKKIVYIDQIIDLYDAFIIDIWGVIYDGFLPYIGTIECLNKIISLDKTIIFLSNAPRPKDTILKKLKNWDINVTEDMVLTSGDLLRHQLIHKNNQLFSSLANNFCYHIGANLNEDILFGLDSNAIKPVEDINIANFLLITSYLEEDEDLDQFNSIFTKSLELNLPLVCANPDTIVPHGDKRRFCAGFFAMKYANMGGEVYYYGKPDSKIFDFAFKMIEQKNINKERTIMIGDTAETDIVGAYNFGIDSALTLSGNGKKWRIKDNIKDENIIDLHNFYQEHLVMPNWVLEKLNFYTKK